MNLRPKTIRRLTVLLIGGCAIAAAASVVVIMQLRRYERHQQDIRQAGMEAYQHGDYRTASEDLSKYLSNDRIDSEAIFASAASRARLPRPDMSNLLDARSQFNRYLELNPGDVAAQHQLLEIYQKLHYSSESIAVADALLKNTPDDIPALQAKVQQLVRDLKFSTALPLSLRLNELKPDDLRSQETTYFLMSRLGQPAPELIGRADGMLKAHPQDPRYEMLRAVAAYFTNDLNGARQWLQTAAKQTPTDADFTLIMVGDFDRMGMWADSLDLLKRADSDPHAPLSVKSALVQRLWEFKQFDAALAQLKDLNPGDPAADSQLIGLQALVLHDRSPHSPELSRDLKVLQSRTDDMTATGWALLLAAESREGAGDALALQQYVAAEHADPDNPDIRFYLAEQYDRMGESELALQCLRQVTKMQPEWPTPYAEIARILNRRGQAFDAIKAAQAACERDFKSQSAQLILEQCEYGQLGPRASASAIKPVLEHVQQLLAAQPNDDDLLEHEVDLLARSDRRSEAVESALTAGSDPKSAGPGLLASLAVIDRTDHLGIADQLADQAKDVRLTSPEDVAAVYGVYVDAGKIDLAGQLLARMGNETGPDWRLAWLQARDSNGDFTDGPDWERFADSLPNNVSVQRAALRSPVVAANRPLMDRIIDRLKAFTGEDGIEWKLARARWLIGAGDDVKNRANAAAELMAEVARACPDYAEPRVIMGDALTRAHDYNGAIASLQLARQLEPQDARITLKLAALHVHEGQIPQAAALLDGIESSPWLDLPGRIEAARLYREAGRAHQAIDLLRDDGPANNDSPDRDVLLAQLLAEQGDEKAAAAIHDRWAQVPKPPVPVVRAAAWYWASHGQSDRARVELARLQHLPLPPGEDDLTLGDFEAAFGTLPAAAARYHDAANTAPANPRIWLHWAGATLQTRDFKEAFNIVARGLKNLPADALLMAMKDRAQVLSQLKLGADAQPLIDALAANPISEAGVTTLGVLSDSQSAQENADALAERLRAVTDRSPRFIPALDLLVALDCQAGRYDAATAAATRAREMMPIDPEPARLLWVVWSTAGRWETALSAADDWRSRTLDHPQAADVAIATAQIELDRPGDAIDQLSPYLNAAIATPTSLNTTTIELTARAMCMQNHTDRARRMLLPLIAESADWRRRWLRIVAETARDSVSVGEQIQAVANKVPPGAIDEQLVLARAWFTAGTRLNDADLLHKAESVMLPLTDSSSAPADAWALLGSIQLRLDSLSDAEPTLAKAVQLAPALAEAKNDLARVKLLRNEDLTTARKLAGDAAAADPAKSGYHTTLGEIDQQLNDLEGARSELQIALRLNPQNAEALICLASVQNRSGQLSESTVTLAHAETVMQSSHPALPAPVEAELRRLREENKKPAASAAVDQKRK